MSCSSKMVDIQTPVFNWLSQRAQYVKDARNWEWVICDPVVGRFATI
jgi:hypothetical protein